MMQIDRRTAMKWVLAAGAASRLPGFELAAAAESSSDAGANALSGYGKDPDLVRTYAPGDLWPLTLNESQRRATTVLCDLILPADEHSPAASQVGVPSFIDEWISAPYPDCQLDRKIILQGLAWLDAQAHARFANSFAQLEAEQATGICHEIADHSRAQPQIAEGALFFEAFRRLAAVGFYTTPLGRQDLRYVGNEPMTRFDGPPLEVLQRVGLA